MDNNQSGTDMNNQNPTPVTSGNSGSADHKNVGPIVATLVIVLILIVAALYVFATRLNQQAIPDDNSVASMSDTSSMQASSTQSVSVTPITNKSTDVQSLQQDLNAATQGVDQQNF